MNFIFLTNDLFSIFNNAEFSLCHIRDFSSKNNTIRKIFVQKVLVIEFSERKKI
jgi:hypothetical protein